jgi:PadR family transcriptional regulator PadR
VGTNDIPSLSKKEGIILELLIACGELYGLDIVRRSDGEVGRGTLYVTLNRMTEKGYVDSRVEDAPAGEMGPPRRLYRPTGNGVRVFNFWKAAKRRFAPSAVRVKPA